MNIEFTVNKFPFKDKEIVSFFEKHQDAFNLGYKSDDFNENTELPNFFDVIENNQRVGLFCCIPSNCSDDIEIAFGKMDNLNNQCKCFVDKVLSRLDKIKSLLPIEWFNESNNDIYRKYWSAIVKNTNKKFETLKYFHEKNGFECEGYCFNDEECFFKKVIE